MHVALAYEYRTGILEPSGDLCVFRGEAILIDRTSGRGAGSDSIDGVLQPNRDPMERPAENARHLFLFESLSLNQRLLAHDRDPGVDFRTVNFDAREASLCQFYRRDFSR